MSNIAKPLLQALRIAREQAQNNGHDFFEFELLDKEYRAICNNCGCSVFLQAANNDLWAMTGAPLLQQCGNDRPDELQADQKRAAWLVGYVKSINGGFSLFFDSHIAKLLLTSALAYEKGVTDPNDVELNRYADRLINAAMGIDVDSAKALSFLQDLQSRIGDGFHPDTPIGEYVQIGTGGVPSFSESEAAELEVKRLEAVRILSDAGIDFYAVLLERIHHGK